MSLSARTRFDVLKRDGFACQYCGLRAPDVVLHVDHITARVNGGGDDPGNLITSCATCNLGKGIDYVITPMLCCICESDTPGLFIDIHESDPRMTGASLLPHFVCKECIGRAVRVDVMARSLKLGRWAVRPELSATRHDVRNL